MSKNTRGETREEAFQRASHWNDEMMELEKQARLREESNQPSMESWDWRWRAEQAEAKVNQLEAELKEYEQLMEQAKVSIYQLQHNFHSMQRNTVRLLKQCHKALDPTLFYYDLDHNPAVRKRQIEERTQAKHDLLRALEIFLEMMEAKYSRQQGKDE